MSEFGCVFYVGPSLLTGDPIVGILTGLDAGSANAKTGRIAQAWILRSDLPPMDAKRANVDDAICGDCPRSGRDGKNSGCYVVPWQGPMQVYKAFVAGDYPVVTWPELQAVVEGRMVRLGAYGDPAAIPFEAWQAMLRTARSWIGYTHQHRRCDRRFRTIIMASVDSRDEAVDAWARGWRTFRIRRRDEPLIALPRRPAVSVRLAHAAEFVCPASDEAHHRTTCEQCRLCRGTSSPARSVAIYPHGKPSSLKAFGIQPLYFGGRPGRPRVVKQSGQIDETLSFEQPLLRAKVSEAIGGTVMPSREKCSPDRQRALAERDQVICALLEERPYSFYELQELVPIDQNVLKGMAVRGLIRHAGDGRWRFVTSPAPVPVAIPPRKAQLTGDDVLAQLRDGPKRTGELMAALERSKTSVRWHTDRLLEQGAVKIVGHSNRRAWALPSYVGPAPARPPRAPRAPSTHVGEGGRKCYTRAAVDQALEDLDDIDAAVQADADALDLADAVEDEPPAPRPRLQKVTLPLRRPHERPPSMKVKPDPAWWVGHPREGFSATAREHQERMRSSKENLHVKLRILE